MSDAEVGTESGSGADRRARDASKVHPRIRVAAEWTWRLLILLAGLYVLVRIFFEFKEVLVPVALAILGSALLVPVVDAMDRRRVPRSLAVLGTMVVAIGVVVTGLGFVVREFIRGVPELAEQLRVTIDRTKEWLVEGPAHLDPKQVSNVGGDILDVIEHNQEKVTSGALATATTAGQIATGGLLTVFLMIFFIYGGGQIWDFLVKAVPSSNRERVSAAGVAGFGTLVGYVRATVIVALVDAVAIGIGLAILGVPLALPLATLVFLGAFIPIVGALLSGSLAVLVALVTQGWVAAAIALAIVVGVMQLESHVMQPFLLGRTVRLHPVAVVLAIAAGIVAGGIVGGLLAVPLVAFLNTFIRDLNGSAPVVEEADDHRPGEGIYVAEPDEPHWDYFLRRPTPAESGADDPSPAEADPDSEREADDTGR
ncbi:AI-2E family transporter [Gordonia sp. ABSL1-1]|uniref:AI-2E family transporter n=1 Tax=Gordonia sp. ABSL1-1 TaxID=3053923 RepID=UPI00257486B5|nr:AI-2E family transporter [Gordonia sp. ABSL1-1]MDL9935160.1 AI-2E family transporter [Gordonia sp. ABSL1-1]